MGGFIMGIMIGIGWYAWTHDMDVKFICFWGMMALINGAFDLVRFIDRAVKSPVRPFDSTMPLSYNLTWLILLLIPVFSLLAAWLAWSIYNQPDESVLPINQRYGRQ